MSDAITITPAPYVTVPLAALMTGFTAKAIERKIQEGVWLEGREYRRAPDGRILISIKGFQSWVEQGSKSGRTRSGSRSPTRVASSAEPSS